MTIRAGSLVHVWIWSGRVRAREDISGPTDQVQRFFLMATGVEGLILVLPQLIMGMDSTSQKHKVDN